MLSVFLSKVLSLAVIHRPVFLFKLSCSLRALRQCLILWAWAQLNQRVCPSERVLGWPEVFSVSGYCVLLAIETRGSDLVKLKQTGRGLITAEPWLQTLVCSWVASWRLHTLWESSDICRGTVFLLGLSIALGSESVLKACMQCSSKSFCALNMRISELIFDKVRAFPGSSVPFGNAWTETGAGMLQEGEEFPCSSPAWKESGSGGCGCCCWSLQCPAVIDSTFMGGSFRRAQKWWGTDTITKYMVLQKKN